MSNTIKAVIFDFGQTLVDSADGFRQAEKAAQQKLFSHLALSLQEPFLEKYRQIRKAFHSRSNFSRQAVWRELYHFYCLTPEDHILEKLEAEYWQIVKSKSILFPGAKAVLSVLNTRYAVALITNTQGQPGTGTHRIRQFPELEKYFKSILVAGENGIPPKPDPVPFRMCLETLGVAAGDAVYVGDDWRIDVCGSRDAGLNPVWLKHEGVKRNWPAVHTDVPVITRLEQLFGLDLLKT